jgi:hypothetical protein
MPVVQFTTTLLRFEKQGEKTGWTYIEIPVEIARRIKPGVKTSYRVKGKLDTFKISGIAMMPMGGGSFIIPVNASMRKGMGKRYGAMVKVQLEEDKAPFKFNKDFIDCLKDEPLAMEFFKTLSPSHQRYFSKWIDQAKTIETKTKRIAQSVAALAKKFGYPEMIRSLKKDLE